MLIPPLERQRHVAICEFKVVLQSDRTTRADTQKKPVLRKKKIHPLYIKPYI